MKRIDKNINKFFCDDIRKPIRTKKECILLLLNTIKIFYIDERLLIGEGKISIIIEKMSRIFYQVENKIVSIVFPFGIEVLQEKYRIYDVELDVDIDSKLISIMLDMLNQYELDKISVEKIIDIYYDIVTDTEDDINVNKAWQILCKLLTMELGYIRYDFDEEHAESIYHPLNHFDVNYSNNITYKIGLKKEIELEDMISILDIKQKCNYLE